LFLLRTRPPPSSPLFPYTTLFRSLLSSCRPPQRRGPRGTSAIASRQVERARQGWRSRAPPRRRAARDGEQGLRSAFRRRCRVPRSEEHTSELQSLAYLVCRLLLEK